MRVDWFPLWLSLEVAGVATLISLALGLWLAWLLANRDFPGRDLRDAAAHDRCPGYLYQRRLLFTP